MPAEDTLPHDITATLLQFAAPAEPPQVRGEWYALGFTPDPATGERLNIGVVLHIGGRQYFRLLPDAAPFACLYGQRKENIAFFLRCLTEHLKAGKLPQKFSPQLICDTPRAAAGDSVEETLDRLYATYITLGRHSKPAYKNLTTDALRSTVKRLVNRRHPAFSHYWQKEPIVLPGKKYTAAVDIYIPERQRFASIVSLDYRKDNSGRLAAACTELETAAQLGGEGTLFIYNPIRDSEQKDDTADVLIDRTYDLLRRHRLSCEVGNTPAQLAEQIPLLAS